MLCPGSIHWIVALLCTWVWGLGVSWLVLGHSCWLVGGRVLGGFDVRVHGMGLVLACRVVRA